MQRERRRDPYPWTWEIPLAVMLASGFAIMLGLQMGRSVANLLAGAGWTWPDHATSTVAGQFTSPIGTALWTSLPGVVTGDSSAGLARNEDVGDQLAGRGLTWGSLIATEVVIVVALAWLGISVLQRWGPGRMRGMATSAGAEQLLGTTRLRKVAGIVRPDLHGKHAGTAPAAWLAVHRRSGYQAANRAEHLERRRGDGLSPWMFAGRGKTEER